MLYTCHYDSPLGDITLQCNGAELTGLWFDRPDPPRILSAPECSGESFPVFLQTARWLDLYFCGEAPDFMPPLCIQATPFRRAVWEITLTIPFGETRTYGQIADQIAWQRGLAKMSAQAVGGALGHNPIALIIPCHRIVGKNGALTGYADGIERKAQLLALERAHANRKKT